MNKKGMVTLALSMVLSLSLAACSSGVKTASDNGSAGVAKDNTAKELIISTFGFNEDLLKKNVYTPFEQNNNVKITVESGNNAERLNKIRLKANQIDVVLLSQSFAQQAIDEGLIEKIDRSKIPNINNLFDIAKAPLGEEYGPAYTIGSSGIVYDKSTAKAPVESYADLWRDEFKGKISLPDITNTEGPMVLDYASKVGGAQKFDADKAFEQLTKLKPNVVKFYTKAADLANMFSQREVSIATTQNFSFETIKKANPNAVWVTPKEGSYAVVNTMNVVKGTKNKELGEKFIDWWLSEQVQKANALAKVDSPVNKNVKLTAEEASGLTYGSDVINNLKSLDWKMVNQSMKTWIDRWNREVVAK
jgi:putative spermidine/putrescine transport system substrate-binding protein